MRVCERVRVARGCFLFFRARRASGVLWNAQPPRQAACESEGRTNTVALRYMPAFGSHKQPRKGAKKPRHGAFSDWLGVGVRSRAKRAAAAFYIDRELGAPRRRAGAGAGAGAARPSNWRSSERVK